MKRLAPILIISAFVVTLVLTSSCTKFTIEQDYMIGTWYLSYEDERISNDGSTQYTFNADGTCLRKVYNALAEQENNTHYDNGTWSISENDSGNKILTIEYMFSDSPSGSDSYIITKKSADSLHLYSYGLGLDVQQHYILTRSK